MSLQWGQNLSGDPTDFTLVPEGEYTYTLMKCEKIMIEKGKYQGEAGAKLTLQITDGTHSTQIIDTIALADELEFKFIQFFASCGTKMESDPVVLDFDSSIGRSGRCIVIQREGTKLNDKGEKMVFNNIQKYLIPKSYYNVSGSEATAKKSAQSNTNAGGFNF